MTSYYGINKDGEFIHGSVSGVGSYIEGLLDVHYEAGDQQLHIVGGETIAGIFPGPSGVRYKLHNGRYYQEKSS